MIITCPDCGARLNVPDEQAGNAGRRVLCPGCEKVFRLADAGRPAGREAPAARAKGPPPAVPPPAAPPRAPAPPAPTPPAPSAPAFDPLATRRMTREDVPFPAEDGGAGPATLEEALAGGGPPRARFEVDRADYQGATFDMDELQDLVKRGWLEPSDGIRVAGGKSWLEAGDHPGLAKAFALKRKMDAQNLAAAAGRKPLACARHPERKAVQRCDSCHRAYCASCGNETELRQKPVVLCLECDVPMTSL